MPITTEQEAIADAGAKLRSGEVLKAIAFAGAGKTFTLKEIARRRKDRGLYLAFNKSIADEAKTKFMGTSCSAKTMHSVAHRVVIGQGGGTLLKNLPLQSIIDQVDLPSCGFLPLPGFNKYKAAGLIRRTLTAFCSSADAEVLPEHATRAIIETMGDPAMIWDHRRRERAEEVLESQVMPAANAAMRLWEALLAARAFTGDTYLKMLDLDDGLLRDAFRGSSYIMLDEAQDLNPVQRSIVTKTGLPLIAVGDPYQQIYSWRGAENALSQLEGQELYLTQSFRFGENIAATGREILACRPDGGPAQRLVGTERQDKITHWNGPAGAYICRSNMGALETALKVTQKSRHPIYLDNFGEMLIDVTEARMLKNGQRIEQRKSTLLHSFNSYAEIEAEAEAGDGDLSRLVKIIGEDRDEDVKKLAEICQPTEAGAKIMIVTGHRAKGREWPTVGLGVDWKSIDEMHQAYESASRNSPLAQTQALEAFNVLYVAVTRAMQTLRDPRPVLFPEETIDPILAAHNDSSSASVGMGG